MSMIDRTFLLPHSKFYEKNLNFIIKTFLDNDYILLISYLTRLIYELKLFLIKKPETTILFNNFIKNYKQFY